MTSNNVDLPALDSVTVLSPYVTRILGDNPGPFTLQGTNSYLVGSGKTRVLIDTTEPKKETYVQTLNDILSKSGQRITHIFLTHWHGDHAGSVSEVRNMCQKLSKVRPAVHKFNTKSTRVSYPVEDAIELTDGQEFKLDKKTNLRVVSMPGHTDDHTGFYLVEQKALFTGDCILGHGSTYFEFLDDYMSTLKKLQSMSNDFNIIYPGHGDVITSPAERITEYIDHRLHKIDQLYRHLLEASKWLTEEKLLDATYPSIPGPKRKAALHNQRQALLYLLQQEKVQTEQREERVQRSTPNLIDYWKAKRLL